MAEQGVFEDPLRRSLTPLVFGIGQWYVYTRHVESEANIQQGGVRLHVLKLWLRTSE
jgi:hypothetical protein